MNHNEDELVKKTSYEWYLEDHDCDIVDPDGWRKGNLDAQYFEWFKKPISWIDYLRKRNLSTTMAFMSRKHRSPYGQLEKYLEEKNEDDGNSSDEELMMPKPPTSCRGGFCVLELEENEDSEEDEEGLISYLYKSCVLL